MRCRFHALQEMLRIECRESVKIPSFVFSPPENKYILTQPPEQCNMKLLFLTVFYL